MSELIELRFENSIARINQLGSALVSLTLEEAEVIPTPAEPVHPYHGVLLAPWPNRIKKGKYQFQGVEYQANINESFGNALHGLLFDAKAEIESQAENSLTLTNHIEKSSQYPWDLTVKISFVLSESGLKVQTTAINNSDTPAPVGLGTHPFFVFDEDSTLEVLAKTMSVHGDDMMPISEVPSTDGGFGTGNKKHIEGVSLDVQFTDIEPVCAVLRTKSWSLEIWHENAKFLMVYTTGEFNWKDGRSRAVAIEPQTCAADAFNNGQGLEVLAPGAKASYVWGARLAS